LRHFDSHDNEQQKINETIRANTHSTLQSVIDNNDIYTIWPVEADRKTYPCCSRVTE